MREQQYSYDIALENLEKIFKTHVSNKNELEKFLQYLNLCREYKTVTMRAIDEMFNEYRKNFSDYSNFTQQEIKEWQRLLYFWG